MSSLSAGIFYCSIAVAFVFAFATGANDVANSFGTSVGSGALTLRRALLIAAFCEFTGAVTLGAGVSDTLVRQISYLDDANCWQCSLPAAAGGHELLFMLGMASALLSGALFLLGATAFAMPVSTTHAVVGAVLGMTAVGAGAACVKWGYPGMLSIVVSWCASPVLAGLTSAAMHLILQHVIFQASSPRSTALTAFPLLYGGSVATVLALVLLKAQLTATWPLWLVAVISLTAAVSVATAVHFLLVPGLSNKSGDEPQGVQLVGSASTACYADETLPDSKLPSLPPEPKMTADGAEHVALLQQHRLQRMTSDGDVDDTEKGMTDGHHSPLHPCSLAPSEVADDVLKDTIVRKNISPIQGEHAAAEQVFKYLQVLTACLKSFAHGANDTANAAGPFAAVASLYLNPAAGCEGITTPLWVLAFCACGIVLGLATWGHRVMQTVGTDIVHMNYSKGFVVELGSTLTVVLASVAGMPISSTHCQIGSVVAVGIAEAGVSNLNWTVFNKIMISWLVTVPLAAVAAAGLLFSFQSVLHV